MASGVYLLSEALSHVKPIANGIENIYLYHGAQDGFNCYMQFGPWRNSMIRNQDPGIYSNEAHNIYLNTFMNADGSYGGAAWANAREYMNGNSKKGRTPYNMSKLRLSKENLPYHGFPAIVDPSRGIIGYEVPSQVFVSRIAEGSISLEKMHTSMNKWHVILSREAENELWALYAYNATVAPFPISGTGLSPFR